MNLPCGTPNYSYSQDMAVVRTRLQWLVLVAFIVGLVLLPFVTSNSWLSVFSIIGITIIAAIGLNLLTGYCGQLSIGHAGFIAVGAYASAIITGKFGMPFLIGLFGGGVMAGLIGLIFGIPSLRVKGFYLAISTVAAQFIIIWVINHWTEMTGGFLGLKVPYAEIAGYSFKSEASQYYLIFTVVALAVLTGKNLARTRVGRAFVAVRDNDLAAQVMGINLFNYKLTAFFIGCFMAGLAGALLAHYQGYISTEFFTLGDSVLYIGMIIIGGLGTAIGPVFGVLFIKLLDQAVQFLSPLLITNFPSMPSGFATGIAPMVFGLVIILFLILQPRGIAHMWNLFKSSYRLWPFSY